MKKEIKNFCQFEIKSLNQENLFNELSKKVKIYDLDRKEKDHSFFKVKLIEMKRVEKELKEKNINIISIKKSGIFNSLITKIMSYGLIVGLLFGFIFFMIQAQFIRKIEVWGNDRISDYDITEVVKKNIYSGYKKNIDTKKIENAVYNKFQSLSFVSISIYGQTLIVNVKEEIIPDEMKGNFDPIIATYDGIITNVELIQGTLCVKEGEIIQAGQTLVKPYILNSNGEEMPVKPLAKIEFDVWINGEAIHNSFKQEIFKTGNTLTQNEIYVGNLKVYEKKLTNNFKDYVVEEANENLTKNNILPFFLKTTTYYELSTKTTQEKFEDVKDEIILKAKENALQKIEEYDIIKEENVTIKQAGNLSFVSYVVTVSKTIGG